MRLMLPAGALGLLVAVLSSGCVAPPHRGVVMPAQGGVLPADARALRYGASGPEVLNNPEVRDKVRALFGQDWSQGRLAFGAPVYFPASSSLRLVRVADQDFIAVSGCVPSACATHRGLLLIRQDATRLMARLDEGGLSHYYDHAPDARASAPPRSTIDGAWNSIEEMEGR
jgi:hypothetical protein